MIEFELKPTFATVDSCFDLVRSHQYGIASYEVFSWSTDIHTLNKMVMKLKSKSLPTGQCHMQNAWQGTIAFTGSIFVCGPLHHHVLNQRGRRTDLVPFPLKHILLDKMLKDHGKVAVSSAVSCFLEINLMHTKFFLSILRKPRRDFYVCIKFISRKQLTALETATFPWSFSILSSRMCLRGNGTRSVRRPLWFKTWWCKGPQTNMLPVNAIVPCHAFCMWHWPVGRDLDLSFIWGHHHLSECIGRFEKWGFHSLIK